MNQRLKTKKIIGLILIFSIIITSVIVIPLTVKATPSPVSHNKAFRIRNVATNEYLTSTPNYFGTENYLPIDPSVYARCQIWKLKEVGNGNYEIYNWHFNTFEFGQGIRRNGNQLEMIKITGNV